MAVHHRNSNFASSRIVLVLTGALVLSVLSAPQAVQAQDAFSCIEELSDDEVQYRIRYIEKDLQKGKKKAAGWRYGWMGGFLGIGGLMTWLAVDAAQENKNWDRFGYAYLAGGAYFTGLMNAVIPAPDVWGAKRIRRMDDSTESARIAKLEYATQTLKKASTVEGFYAGPFGVVTATLYGVVGGTIKATQWVGKSRGLTAAIYVAPPIMLGFQTATAPVGAMRSWENYRGIACSSKYYDRHEEGPELDFSFNPAGGAFRVSF